MFNPSPTFCVLFSLTAWFYMDMDPKKKKSSWYVCVYVKWMMKFRLVQIFFFNPHNSANPTAQLRVVETQGFLLRPCLVVRSVLSLTQLMV